MSEKKRPRVLTSWTMRKRKRLIKMRKRRKPRRNQKSKRTTQVILQKKLVRKSQKLKKPSLKHLQKRQLNLKKKRKRQIKKKKKWKKVKNRMGTQKKRKRPMNQNRLAKRLQSLIGWIVHKLTSLLYNLISMASIIIKPRRHMSFQILYMALGQEILTTATSEGTSMNLARVLEFSQAILMRVWKCQNNVTTLIELNRKSQQIRLYNGRWLLRKIRTINQTKSTG